MIAWQNYCNETLRSTDVTYSQTMLDRESPPLAIKSTDGLKNRERYLPLGQE